MDLLVLALVLLACLLLIPLGLPGTWLMIVAAFAYPYLGGGTTFGLWTLGGTAGLALIAELFELTLSARYTRKYGGSRRAGWGAIIGGMVGAIVGVPVPIVGPVIGALLGSFVGALAFELSRGTGHGAATRVAWGALVGRVAAMALKTAFGVMIATWILLAAWQ